MPAKLFGWLMLYFVRGWGVGWLTRDRAKKFRRRADLVSRFSRRVLRLLGHELLIEESLENDALYSERRRSRIGRLIVANHVSFLDVLAVSAVHPAIFITSVEKAEIPGVSALARAGGCLFVERRHRGRVRADILQVSEVLRMGIDVVLFPEGTTGDGLQLLPFKRGMFRAAREAAADVLPIAIRYTVRGGQDPTDAERDSLFFFGEFGIMTHLHRIFSWRGVKIVVRSLPAVRMQEHAFTEQVKAIRASIKAALERSSSSMPFLRRSVCAKPLSQNDRKPDTVSAHYRPLD